MESRLAAACYSGPGGAMAHRPGPDGAGLLRGPGGLERGIQGEAAVDEERLAGDVRGLVRAQECSGRRHLLGASRPAHRDVAFYHAPLDRVVNPGPVDRGDGRAGADAVDPYPARRVLQGQRPGEVLHAALGHRIAEEPW